MPPTKSIEAAFSSMITAAVRGAVRKDIAGLRREVRKLQRRVERARSAAPRVRRGKGKPGRKPRFLSCQVVGCDGKPVAWGFCQTHYNRFKYRGTLKRLAKRVEAGEQVGDQKVRGRGRRKARRGRAVAAAPRAVAARRVRRGGRRRAMRRRRAAR